MTLILSSLSHCTRCIFSSSLTRLSWPTRSLTLPKNPPSPRLANNHRQSSKFDWTKLTDFLHNLDSFLRTQKDPVVIDKYIHGRLSQLLPKTKQPQDIYQKVISFLVKSKRIKDGISVYRRMIKETVIPSSHTQAEMAAVTLASEPDVGLQSVLDILAMDPAFTEDHLLHLLLVAADLDAPYDRLLHFASMFIESRGDTYTPNPSVLTKLLETQLRAGRLEEALETAIRYDDEESESRPGPYATIMSTLSHTNLSDGDAFEKVLQEMKIHNVSPNIDIFNNLLSRELRLNSIAGAFSLYHLVVELSKDSPTSPNAVTFALLFKFLANAYSFDTRSARTRSFKRPSNIVPPRQLFRDMLLFHNHSGFPVHTHLLNLALRTFVQSADYSGALVALKSFQIFRLRPSVKTYSIVIRHLVRRIRGDLRLRREWGYQFMGLTSVTEKQGLKLDDLFTQRFIASACCPRFNITGDPFLYLASPQPKPQYEAPTLAMIDGEANIPDNARFDVVPLQRILGRAALANSVQGDNPASLRLSAIIAEAKSVMLPGPSYSPNIYNEVASDLDARLT